MRVFLSRELAAKKAAALPAERERMDAVINRLRSFNRIFALIFGDLPLGDDAYLRRDHGYNVYYAKAKTLDGTEFIVVSDMTTDAEEAIQRRLNKLERGEP